MGPFERLVREACASEYRYIEYSSDTRMSCGAIVDGCLERAGSSPERLNSLRRRLEDPQQHLPGCRAFRRQVAKLFAEGRLSGSIPANLARMNVSSARDDAQFELMQLGHSLFELWSLSAQDAEIRHPECFGSVTDMGIWKESQAKLKAERDALFERIAQEFQPSDTAISQVRSDGSVFVYFKLAPAVALYPLHSVGARLVTHLLNEDPSWAVPRAPEEPQRKQRKVSSG